MAANLARSRLRTQSAPPPPVAAAPMKDEATREAERAARVRELLDGDEQLRTWDSVLRETSLEASAEEAKVIWAQVKGFPWWPVRARAAQLRSARPQPRARATLMRPGAPGAPRSAQYLRGASPVLLSRSRLRGRRPQRRSRLSDPGAARRRS